MNTYTIRRPVLDRVEKISNTLLEMIDSHPFRNMIIHHPAFKEATAALIALQTEMHLQRDPNETVHSNASLPSSR